MTDKERLVNEWIEHGKIVLAVDYDDTIFPWKHRTQEQCNKTLRLVKWCQSIGAHIVIHTASDEDRYEEILDYCRKKGLKVDAINKNPIELPYGKQGKIYYNWQLCDRSGLTYASVILNRAAKEVITKQRKDINLTDVG